MTTRPRQFEIDFVWKEEVVYWEGHRGFVFWGAWGVEPIETYVPDAASWDRVVPSWLRGRYDEVVRNLRSDPHHVVIEERDDATGFDPERQVTRGFWPRRAVAWWRARRSSRRRAVSEGER